MAPEYFQGPVESQLILLACRPAVKRISHLKMSFKSLIIYPNPIILSSKTYIDILVLWNSIGR